MCPEHFFSRTHGKRGVASTEKKTFFPLSILTSPVGNKGDRGTSVVNRSQDREKTIFAPDKRGTKSKNNKKGSRRKGDVKYKNRDPGIFFGKVLYGN